MGYLFHFVGAIALLALSQSALGPPISEPVPRGPLLVIGLGLVPYAVALLARRAFVRGRFRQAAALMAFIHASPVLLFGVAVGFCGWAGFVERWSGRSAYLVSWPHPVLLVALLPFFAYGLVAIDARARAAGGLPATLRADRAFHTRMFLGAGAPIAVFVTIAWLAGLSEAARVHIEEVSVWSAAFSIFLVAIAVWSLPRLLALAWDTVPLGDSPARELLEWTATRASFRCRDLFVWRTGNLVANAAIVGLTPGQRIVLFSDALLSSLDPRELIAVFAHEIGHARRHHVMIFGAWALGFLMVVDLGLARLDSSDELLALGLGIPLLGFWFTSFGYLSRRFELEADLYSLELTRDGDALSSALLRVGGGLHAAKRGSWRHFSTERRIQFIERASSDPAVGRKLRLTLRTFAIFGTLVFVVASAFQIARMTETWHADQVTADLRLGRYAEADARLPDVTEASADFTRVVERAGELARSGQTSIRELEALAVSELAQGQAQSARDLVELLLLRGERLESVAAALEDPERADEVDASEVWRAALSSWARVTQ